MLLEEIQDEVPEASPPSQTPQEVTINQNQLSNEEVKIPKSGSRCDFKIASQNVHGLKDSSKLEHAADQMMSHQVGAFLPQETYVKGNAMKKARECTTLARGLEKHASSRGEEAQQSLGPQSGLAAMKNLEVSHQQQRRVTTKTQVEEGLWKSNCN